MEVHAHPHLASGEIHTARKKWTHYFWEFLMLFLAVFCGFLAEYQLEHKIERERGRTYVKSMIEDLKADTAALAAVIAEFDQLNKRFDTALRLYPDITRGYNDTLWRSLPAGFPDFIKSNKTMQQLLFSGGLRLITSKQSADGIVRYELSNDDLDIDINSLSEIGLSCMTSRRALMNLMDLDTDKKKMTLKQLKSGKKNYLLRTDLPFLGNYYNEIKSFKAVCIMVKNRQIKLMAQAASLIELLRKEYRLPEKKN
jgi:hypothetical protein